MGCVLFRWSAGSFPMRRDGSVDRVGLNIKIEKKKERE